ncbi:MAG: proline--tRNA ligase [Thermoplasmata archaeon]|nr:proline--tRNA ligase [Thermoplasmata archaeon]
MRDPEEFNDWYVEIVERAGLADKRYPIKGMNVWTGYGWKAMRLIDGFIRYEFDGTNHQEVCFPLLIPETEFQKEADHIKGFSSEVYWVTKAGDNELDVPLVLRPTSETAMYPIFSLWVRSHADLPLKTYQIVNVFRYETKQTRAFIRMREIHFFEAHTCHVDFEDAERQIAEDLEIIKRFSRKTCLPYVLCKRPDWDKFAGAFYTIGIDSLMPTGRTLQMGSIHQYKENFSRPYEITYEDESGEHQHVHQTTFGMSERILGTLISIHADDKGIVLPPEIAPYQVVIVPILAKDRSATVNDACEQVSSELCDAGLRIHLDNRDLRPGNKFFDWELKGVPLRLEIGLRDIESNVVTVARRDTGERSQVKSDNLAEQIKKILDEIQQSLFDKADDWMMGNLHAISDPAEAGEGINSMHWCGEEDCGHQIEEITGMAMIGVPVDAEPTPGSCVICGKSTEQVIYAARSY